jgi:hypothetical protein
MQLRLTVFVFFLFLGGCAAPLQTGSLDFRARAETQVEGDVRVTAVALSPQETENSFTLPLAKEGIQPVWLEIENREDKEYYLNLLSIDQDYFSPSELAWLFRGEGEGDLYTMIDNFLDKHIQIIIPPQSTVSGFVYTNFDPGVKAFVVELFSKQNVRLFEFVQVVPGFEADFMRVDFNQLYSPNQIRDVDLEGLRKYLESLPCCVLGGDRKTAGDPLNLVIVGDGQHVLGTLVRQHWDLTETIRGYTRWRTIASSLFGSKYRTSPISSLYLFGRTQDAALQKVRANVDERNHLRLWLAPVTFEGKQVWIGQISRDIGVKFSTKTLITHKIDPVIDEARLYITLDVAASQSLRALGYVKGVGLSGGDSPRVNYTNDPYYTDGNRVVLILGKQRYSLDRVEFLPFVKLKGREEWIEETSSPK